MHDQPTQPDSTTHSAAPAQADVHAPEPAADVLRIIADVEGHLTRLRSAQKQQDDAIASLTSRSKALRAAEEQLEHQRTAHKQQQAQLERDRAALAAEREQFIEKCRRIDAELRQQSEELDRSKQALEQERSETLDRLEQARTEAQQLDEAKNAWQQHVAQMEAQLQRTQEELDARQAQIASAKDQLDGARSRWEQERQDADAALRARESALETRAADLHKREQALVAARREMEAQLEQSRQDQMRLQQRAEELETEQQELHGRVEQAERNVGQLIAQLEQTQQELLDQTKAAKDALERFAAAQQREHALEKALERANAQAAKAEKDSAELLRIADSERADVQAKLESARREFEQAREARDAAMAELEIARKKIASMQRDLQTRDEALASHEARITDLQKKLELASSKLSEFATVLSEQTPQLERGAAALAMVEEQAEQIDRLTSQLAELQLASDPDEIRRRDDRINELTEALRQARGQNGGDVAVGELEQRNAALEAEVKRLRHEAQNAQIAADEARAQLQAYVDSGAESAVQSASLSEHAAKIAALTAELERQAASSAQEMERRLSAQSKKHEQELASAREHQREAAAMRQKIADLEAKLAQAKSDNATAAAAGNQADSEYLSRLRAKAEQVTRVAEHLRRRRTRLEKARRLMQQKRKAAPNAGAQGSAAMRSEQLSQIEREKQHLLEVRKMLAQLEFKMIRRWARQKAILIVTGLVLTICASAALTWLVVEQFFPAVRSASVVLEARQRPGSPALNDEQKEDWTIWHAEIVKNPAFQQTLAKRMAERQLNDWARPEAVAAQLARNFSIDASQQGMVVYSMSGERPSELTSFLDVLAQTVVAESNRTAGQRSDGAQTLATGERKIEGRVAYASLNPMPVKDERMEYALPIFGGTLGALLVLVVGLYAKLARARRVFDEENSNLFEDLKSAATPA